MARALWIIIACGALILTLSTGLRASFGLFLKPMTVDLDISRGVFAFAIGLQNLLWGVASPFAGAWADRLGTGRVILAGAFFYALGLAGMAFGTDGSQIVLAQVLVGFGLAGAGFSTVLGAVGRAAPPEKRSMALGIAAAGGSFGQFAIVPYGHELMSHFGWHWALFGLALTSLLIVPLAAGVAGKPAGAGAGRQSLGDALREAMTHRGFILLTLGFFVCGFQVVFVATHLPAYLADKAMPSWLGAWSLALVGLGNIVGTYACGWLGGRYPKKNLLALLYLLRSLVFLVFILMPLTEASVLVFAGTLGLLWLGTVPLTSGLVAYIFGPAYMSMLYGIVFLSHQVGSFTGSWLAGVAYDLTGSYDVMWWGSVAMGLVAAALNWPIMERPVARLTAVQARA